MNNTFDIRNVTDQSFEISKILMTERYYNNDSGYDADQSSDIYVCDSIDDAIEEMKQRAKYIYKCGAEIGIHNVLIEKQSNGYIKLSHDKGYIEYIIEFIYVPISINFITVNTVEVV